MSDCILLLSNSHSPVFLLNSCLDLFSAPPSLEDSLSRSYGVNLPSSLTVNLPSALVYSTQPRVSVYGTGTSYVKLSGFSRQQDYPHYQSPQVALVLSYLNSQSGFAYSNQRLNTSTPNSVWARRCHNCVSTSPYKVVTEY